MRPRPKAKAMPTMPTLSPATTAVPTPKNTRKKVPTSSAKYFFILPPVFLLSWRLLEIEPGVDKALKLVRLRWPGWGKPPIGIGDGMIAAATCAQGEWQ